jgi:hypothetical protein
MPRKKEPAMSEPENTVAPEQKTRKTPVRKSPAEKAQAVLDAANKRVEKAEKRRDTLREQLDAAETEFSSATAAQSYAAGHPDLSA